MSFTVWGSLALTFIAVVLTPVLVILVRLTVKWTRVEDKLQMVADDLKEIVADKDKTHAEMLAQMREDRAATDRRLRWLETNLWTRGRRPNVNPND